MNKITSKKYYSNLSKEEINCPICSSDSSKPLLNRDRYSMGLRTVICNQCSLIYINPRPTESEMSNFYKNDYRTFYESVDVPTKEYIDKGPFIPRAKFVLNVLKPYLSKSKNFLDIGCAEGTLLMKVEKEYSSVKTFGIEPSKSFGAYAKKQLKGLVFIGGYQQFIEKHPDVKYDVLTSTHVLEHILDPKAFIKSISNLMHNDSVFYIEVPNIMSDKLNGIGSVHIGHVLSYDPFTLKILLNNCGLEIINLYTTGLPSLTPAMAVICRLASDVRIPSYPSKEEVLKKSDFFVKKIAGKNVEHNKKFNILQRLKKKLLG